MMMYKQPKGNMSLLQHNNCSFTQQIISRQGKKSAIRKNILLQSTFNQPLSSQDHGNSTKSESSPKKLFQRRHIGLAGGLAGLQCFCCPGPVHNLFKPQPAFAQPSPAAKSNVCYFGTNQSPVAIPQSVFKDRFKKEQIIISQKQCTVKDVFTPKRESMKVLFNDNQYTRIGERQLVLRQYHFHSPAEHRVDGLHYPLEAHLVHQDIETGQFVVFAIMAKSGDYDNRALKFCLKRAQPYDSVQNVTLTPKDYKLADPANLLPDDLETYARYYGSLTTPPCTEQVEWIVFEDTIEVSHRQVIDFQYFLGNGVTFRQNARPVQRDQDVVEFL